MRSRWYRVAAGALAAALLLALLVALPVYAEGALSAMLPSVGVGALSYVFSGGALALGAALAVITGAVIALEGRARGIAIALQGVAGALYFLALLHAGTMEIPLALATAEGHVTLTLGLTVTWGLLLVELAFVLRIAEGAMAAALLLALLVALPVYAEGALSAMLPSVGVGAALSYIFSGGALALGAALAVMTGAVIALEGRARGIAIALQGAAGALYFLELLHAGTMEIPLAVATAGGHVTLTLGLTVAWGLLLVELAFVLRIAEGAMAAARPGR